MQLTLHADAESAIKTLSAQRTRIPSTVANALTQTAHIAQQNEIKEMRDVFDRPTPWTLGGVGVKESLPSNLRAQVFLKDEAYKGTPVAKYLQTEITGGTRAMKGFENSLRRKGLLPEGMYAVPGPGARIDPYGNMEAGQITQILSYFEATGGRGLAPMSKGRRKQLRRTTVSRQGFYYFAVGEGERLHAGIWQYFLQQRQAIPVMLFVDSARYDKRYDFQYVVDSAVSRNFSRILADLMAHA